MGLMLLKKFSFLFLLLSAGSLLSTSLAGRHSAMKLNGVEGAIFQEEAKARKGGCGEEEVVHERLLRMNTKDYGRYDPTPSLSKPHFKLIPN